MAQLEIAVTSLADAAGAVLGGADSIEISRDLSVGGLTPDVELVAAVVREYRQTGVAIHVMVRPHEFGFVYGDDDLNMIRSSVETFKLLGVKGVVFGACGLDGLLDCGLIDELRRVAEPLILTTHRALDLSVEPESALERLAEIGVKRVLTAGPALTAWEGRVALGKWVARFAGKMEFVVSGGLTTAQLGEMCAVTQAQTYHFGSAARRGGVVDAGLVAELGARVRAGI